jgi:hypothetical protein
MKDPAPYAIPVVQIFAHRERSRAGGFLAGAFGFPLTILLVSRLRMNLDEAHWVVFGLICGVVVVATMHAASIYLRL